MNYKYLWHITYDEHLKNKGHENFKDKRINNFGVK